ncbi:hypothetical protein ACFQL1_09985 [Halomicroarcula sp. GCM10025709]|uniref:hypothetical protein n=1 Tax=Haloarcula TaxID=2237 RepID=UPI0024C2FC74|nr:hypothetical protein [Halomicroarcula sp. YJ-61-S]
MSLDRRQFLAAGAGAASALTAGCAGRLTQCVPFGGDGLPHDAALAVTPVDSVPDDADTVALADFAEREREMLRTAIDEGVVRACMREETDRTAALDGIADAVGVDTYLTDGSDAYGLWVRITDQVFAASGDPPEDDASPCC